MPLKQEREKSGEKTIGIKREKREEKRSQEIDGNIYNLLQVIKLRGRESEETKSKKIQSPFLFFSSESQILKNFSQFLVKILCLVQKQSFSWTVRLVRKLTTLSAKGRANTSPISPHRDRNSGPYGCTNHHGGGKVVGGSQWVHVRGGGKGSRERGPICCFLVLFGWGFWCRFFVLKEKL